MKRKKRDTSEDDERLAERFEADKNAREWYESVPVKVEFRRPLKHFVRLTDGRRVTLAQYRKLRRSTTPRKRSPSP